MNIRLQLLICSISVALAVLFCTPANGQSIAGGAYHSLFLCSDSTVWAVGKNQFGQLGDGTTIDRLTPVQVSGLSAIIAISSGTDHALFLKQDGSVWAVGRNDYGQLGDGTTIDKSIPVQVGGLDSIKAIACGYNHSLFLKQDGTVWAVGLNLQGQLGDGTTNDNSTVVQVSGLTSVTAIAGGGGHSVFLKQDSTVWALGANTLGQLGDGTTNNTGCNCKTYPVQVSGLSSIISIAASSNFSLFLNQNGTAWAVGANGSGQHGDGTTAHKSIPVQVSGLTSITAIAGGLFSSFFLMQDSTVWSVGNNGYGQLGDGTTVNKSIPVQVSGFTSNIAIASGWWHALVLKQDNTAWAVGRNDLGQLGDGNIDTTGCSCKSTHVQTVCLCGSGITDSTLTLIGCDIYTLNGISYDSSGTYKQIHTNISGCDSVVTLHITINSSTTNTIDTTISSGQSISIADSTYTATGTYTHIFTASNGCDSIVILNLTVITGISTAQISGPYFMIYPNPNYGSFIIERQPPISNSTNSLLTISNLLGETVYQARINNSSTHIRLQVPVGIYITRIENEDGIWQQKMVVQ